MANLYVIRFVDGTSSPPLKAEEIISRFQKGELRGSDRLSIYPNEFAMELRDFREFRSLFGENPHTQTGSQSSFPDTSEPTPKVKEAPKNEFDTDESTKLTAAASARSENQKTRLIEVPKTQDDAPRAPAPVAPAAPLPVPMDDFSDGAIRSEKTRVFERPKELLPKTPVKRTGWRGLVPQKSFMVMVLLVLVFYEMNEDDEEAEKAVKPKVSMVVIRPKLPATGTDKPDPQKSTQIYESGLATYAQDTVRDYQVASEIFQRAIRVDPHNVKALAFLASCYLNLIESSNKDESTYSVINKIIELSKDRQLDLLETVIAEVEFLAAQRRYDAGIQKLTEYSKVTGKFDPAIYYYLGWLFAQKGEYASAMKHLNMIPPNSFSFPSLFYLRGFLFEENQDYVQAEAEYVRALAISKHHAKSILGRVRISEKKGELKTRAREVRFLLSNPSYQNPKEYIQTLIYSSKLALIEKNTKAAVSALEDATRIDPRNEVLKLEYFTLLSNLGSDPKFKMLAQMYSLVLEADRKQKAGNLHEAKATLLEAQDIFPKSTVPLEKIGDLFFKTGEFTRAHDNYKKALDLDKDNGQLAIKVIDSLIKNKETSEAEVMIAKYRTHPKLKSYVDRLAGDLAYDQADYNNAATFYRKAMSRDTIDPEVYTAYANLMREADQCRDAQFFYSFAQRLDPFNYHAIMGTAKCILKTDGVESAVGRVQEELARLPKARADLLAGVAEIYFLAHDEAKALQFVQNAKEVDPEYPESYKIEGDIFYHQMSFKREMKKYALDAWKSYSDRKNSDPYGYLKRFEVFLQDSNFEAADEELNRIFMISPRYPELHYRRAVMYRKMGRIKDGLRELDLELKNNPRFDPAWVEQGESYLRDGAINDALKSFSKAMSLNPKSAQAKIGAGYANYLKKQYASAIALLQAALAIDKGNPEIYKKLGMAYRDSGDQARARQAFQSYLDLAPDAPDRGEYEAYKR